MRLQAHNGLYYGWCIFVGIEQTETPNIKPRVTSGLLHNAISEKKKIAVSYELRNSYHSSYWLVVILPFESMIKYSPSEPL